jgi:hypothetical protein
VELGGRATRARVERIDARVGTVVWRRCSRVAFIGRGTTGGGRSRSNRRRLGGASMAKPFRVGRKWGGEMGSRGRGTAAPIRFAAGEEGRRGGGSVRGRFGHHDLGVVGYKDLTGLSLLRVSHFRVRCGASL